MTDDATPDTPNALKETQRAFLAAYTKCGNIHNAAKAAHVGRTTVYDWLDHSPPFKGAFEAAKCAHRETVEQDVLLDRLYQTDSRGQLNCPPLLVIFYLKAVWRDKYGDNVKPEDNAASELLKRLEAMSGERVKAAVIEDITSDQPLLPG